MRNAGWSCSLNTPIIPPTINISHIRRTKRPLSAGFSSRGGGDALPYRYNDHFDSIKDPNIIKKISYKTL